MSFLSRSHSSRSLGPGEHRRKRALQAMFCATLLFALMGAFTKGLTISRPGTVPLSGGEIAFFRYLAGIATMLLFKPFLGLHLLGKDRKGLLWRGISGGFAATLFFFGIQKTTLTHATLLNLSYVIWGPLIAVFTLNESLTKKGVTAVVVAIIGVILITDPNLLLQPKAQEVNIGDGLALLSGILSGFAVAAIRRLRQGETAYSIFFYFNLVGLPISLLLLRISGSPFLVPTGPQALLLLGTGVTSVGAQLLMTYGYREMTATQGSLINITSVLYSTFLSWAIFHEMVTVYTIVGGALVLFSSWLMNRPDPPLIEERDLT